MITKTRLPIQLIVGLGNPGPQYEETRHNAGMWLVNEIAAKYHADLRLEAKFHGFFADLQIENFHCKLLIPTTFMNCSGKAVQALVNFYKIPSESILVVHDELDFPPGVARLKFGGGPNGQKGVQDIISALGSGEFYRLRIGIGRPMHHDAAAYVLSKPSLEDKIQIDHAIQQAIAILPDLLQGQIQEAMQALHADDEANP